MCIGSIANRQAVAPYKRNARNICTRTTNTLNVYMFGRSMSVPEETPPLCRSMSMSAGLWTIKCASRIGWLISCAISAVSLAGRQKHCTSYSIARPTIATSRVRKGGIGWRQIVFSQTGRQGLRTSETQTHKRRRAAKLVHSRARSQSSLRPSLPPAQPRTLPNFIGAGICFWPSPLAHFLMCIRDGL